MPKLGYEFALPFGPGSAGQNQYGNAALLAKTRKSSVIDIIEKNSPAHIAVVGFNNKGYTGITYFLSNKFFLQGISEAGQEKLQVLETFDNPMLLFFNQRMRAFNFRGIFLDGDDPEGGISNYWTDAFRIFYEKHLRGTKLVDNGQIAVLTVNNQMYTGYPTTMQLGIDSQRPMLNTFNMTWAITDIIALPPLSPGEVLTKATVGQNLIQNIL